MKVNCALVASLLVGVCDLLTAVRAYSDYNAELDARDNVDYLSTRDFAYEYQKLDAREPAAIEVPFHPSIRDFLEEAAVMYRRGGRLSICRGKPLGEVNLSVGPPVTTLVHNQWKIRVYDKDTGASIKKRISELLKGEFIKIFSTTYTLKIGDLDTIYESANHLGDGQNFVDVAAPLLACQLDNPSRDIKVWAGGQK
ncbi:hypothetical protein DFP72DRAFT_637448 [Ephemerocybe angulata]|uniref:Uncharacterized protein n=1 Tax=Ephemerocybe angulata TaxID=980116 RepID=A0A8H6LXB0_9AGAR|nr:hypothetical protein DFP72DRAFT_637448 [Tulosesus angulatus]